MIYNFCSHRNKHTHDVPNGYQGTNLKTQTFASYIYSIPSRLALCFNWQYIVAALILLYNFNSCGAHPFQRELSCNGPCSPNSAVYRHAGNSQSDLRHFDLLASIPIIFARDSRSLPTLSVVLAEIIVNSEHALPLQYDGIVSIVALVYFSIISDLTYSVAR